ncbi:hypothetical protein GA0115245_118730 [Streptomyces sp. di188]|nr:hypothetical protein GA0115238_123330 [Streptomyces sp. di50b]SCE02381.1 hypothetical protein GA0115245_118730 [Streptomyces sp. di188]
MRDAIAAGVTFAVAAGNELSSALLRPPRHGPPVPGRSACAVRQRTHTSQYGAFQRHWNSVYPLWFVSM